jgi:hypothetical protein
MEKLANGRLKEVAALISDLDTSPTSRAKSEQPTYEMLEAVRDEFGSIEDWSAGTRTGKVVWAWIRADSDADEGTHELFSLPFAARFSKAGGGFVVLQYAPNAGAWQLHVIALGLPADAPSATAILPRLLGRLVEIQSRCALAAWC